VTVFGQDGGSSQKRRKLRRKLTDQPVGNATGSISDQPVELDPSPVDDQIKPLNETQETTERAGRGSVFSHF